MANCEYSTFVKMLKNFYQIKGTFCVFLEARSEFSLTLFRQFRRPRGAANGGDPGFRWFRRLRRATCGGAG